jgi:hypothetical protein
MAQASLPGDLEKVYVALLDALASPLAQHVKLLVKSQRWDELVSIKVRPSAYDKAEDYFRDAAAVSFIRKCESLDTTVDRQAVAEENFLLAERQCARSNERLAIHFLEGALDRDNGLIATSEGACARLIAEARKEMSKLLGKLPSDLKGRFGPGATYGDKGRYTTVPDKMSSRPTLTTSALWFHVFQWSGTAWAHACAADGRESEFVRGNRFTTVAKDCTKDRGIAIEPSVNLFYQLGVGRAIRTALKRNVHIDITHGQAIHRRVACEASTHGRLATLDLSNASDTISTNLVKLVTPRPWFELLNSLRSPFTLFREKWVHLEKFSSMGNGFTFELETAVFLAVILAVRNLRAIDDPRWASVVPGKDIFVYGDDIIVPTELASDVIAALTYCGCSINKDKSFVDGPFRESCGGDYFGGVDVRPFFLKEFPDEPQDWITVVNGLRNMAVQEEKDGFDLGRSYLLRPWFVAQDSLPTHIRRLRGPKKLGDLVIHDECERWQTRKRGAIHYIRAYRPARFSRIGWQNWKGEVVLATAVYGTGDGKLGVTPRDAVLGYKVGWVPLPSASSNWLPASEGGAAPIPPEPYIPVRGQQVDLVTGPYEGPSVPAPLVRARLNQMVWEIRREAVKARSQD